MPVGHGVAQVGLQGEAGAGGGDGARFMCIWGDVV